VEKKYIACMELADAHRQQRVHLVRQRADAVAAVHEQLIFLQKARG
jgi:hypothetical protein